MGFVFSATKCIAFCCNLMCLIMGIGAIGLSTCGLETAKPGTEEHTYFIVGIILGAFICMSTLLGIYGILSELVGVNLIFACFVVMLMFLEYLQMQSFRPFAFYNHAMQHLRYSWNLIKTHPAYMHTLEADYHCCGFYGSRDYNYLELPLPSSCYNHKDAKDPTNLFVFGCWETIGNYYDSAIKREKLFSRTLLLMECTTFVLALVLSAALCYRRRRAVQSIDLRVPGFNEPTENHVTSRTNLLP